MFTENKDFYPTPDLLAKKMASKIDSNFCSKILEPSAGSGNLIKAVQDRFDRNYSYSIDCIEPDSNLRSILNDNCHNVVGYDFLTFNGHTQYSTIIMNPPFSNGVHHVLRAYEMIYDGDVIALLNAETIKNPFSKERQLLLKIINSNSNNTIEFIAGAFKEAERTTGVEVVLIHLKKRGDYITDFFKLDNMTTAQETIVEDNINTQIALKQSKITEIVNYYNLAIETAKDSIIKKGRAIYYKKLLNISGGSTCYESINIKEEVNKEIVVLRNIAWDNIWTLSEFSKIMTLGVRREFEKKKEKISKLEFNESNIREFLQQLYLSHNSIFDNALLEVFDMFTRYHENNNYYHEGWKSNTKHEIGSTTEENGKPKFLKRRVVLPYIIGTNWNGGLQFRDFDAEQKCSDIDKILKRLAGKDTTVVNGIGDVLKRNQFETGTKHSTEFFDIRVYKKKTIHFYFKDPKLLQRLNIEAGKLRNWLSHDETTYENELLKLSYDGG